MGNLEDGPEGLVALFALVGGVLGVFHLVAEFEEGVFDVVEAGGRGFAGAGGADGGHVGRGWRSRGERRGRERRIVVRRFREV